MLGGQITRKQPFIIRTVAQNLWAGRVLQHIPSVPFLAQLIGGESLGFFLLVIVYKTREGTWLSSHT